MATGKYSESTRRVDLLLSVVLAACLILLVFLAARWTRDWSLFSLVPPGGGVADVLPGQREDLHRTFFTVWASMVLAAPAIALLPFSWHRPLASRLWGITWTASLLVFAVHFYWAIVILFGNDWDRVLNTPRVTAPRLDTVFAIWWTLDVLLAWLVSPLLLWVRVERVGVHLLAVVLFFAGAAREGELPASRALGWLFVAIVIFGLAGWLIGRTRRSRML